MKKGLQVDQDCLFSMRGGITSVLVVETKCNVLLVKEGKKKPSYFQVIEMNITDSPNVNAPLPWPLSSLCSYPPQIL